MSRPLSGADALRTLMPVSPLSRGNRCLPTYSTAIRTELKRSLAGCCGGRVPQDGGRAGATVRTLPDAAGGLRAALQLGSPERFKTQIQNKRRKMNTGFGSGTRSRVVRRVRPLPAPLCRPPHALCSAVPRALTADGVLEVGALGGVVGELNPAEPPESLRPAGRVVPLLRGTGLVRAPQRGRAPPAPESAGTAPYLQEEEFEGVRPLQPGDLQLRLVGAALALHFGAPRQRNVGLLRDQLPTGSGAQTGDPAAAPRPRRPPEPLPRPHSHPRSCWPTRRKGRRTWRRIPP